MGQREVDDRIVLRRQHLANLHLPLVPLIAPPEVIRPEEPAFQDELAKLRRLLVIEPCAAGRGHQHERTLKEGVIGGTDEQWVRLRGVKLTGVFVSSDKRIDMLMSARGKSVRQLPPVPVGEGS